MNLPLDVIAEREKKYQLKITYKKYRNMLSRNMGLKYKLRICRDEKVFVIK